MNKSLKTFLFLLSTAFIILSTACGGSDTPAANNDYTGSTTPAAIDASNAELIGKAAGESIQKADATNDLPISIVVNNNPSLDLTQLNATLIEAASSAFNTTSLPTGVAVPAVPASPCDSGTSSFSFTGGPTGAVTISTTYNNCTLTGSTITVTGRFDVHFDDIQDTSLTAAYSFNYINFTISDSVSGTSATINASLDCPTGFDSCVMFADFTGTDGNIHRVASFSFINTVDGFNGTADFYHATYGQVSIIATNITYGNCGTYPDGGDVSFSSTDGSSGTIIFGADCSVSGTWNNGTGTVSF